MDLELKGRVAIVTGGSDGIGKAAAISLAREGADVAILARTQARLDSAAEEIRAEATGEVAAISCDVCDRGAVDWAVQQVVEKWGRLDILVNNAGTGAAARFDSMTAETLSADLQLKVYGAMYCSQACIPHMQRAKWGRIINITTASGKAAPGSSLPTALSRAAGIAMTKAMSKDFASDNILVNTVCIGVIKSGQNERRWQAANEKDPSLTLDAWYESTGGDLPLGRVGEASEAGDLICFLASERASYVSGTAVNVDGGRAPVV